MSDLSSRRKFLTGAAAAVAALPAGGLLAAPQATAPTQRPAAQPRKLPAAGQFPVKAISSKNGLAATKRAYELLMQGKDTLDACVEGVTIVENDPNDMTVGYGGLPNEEGVVELDAAVMHGPTHQAGSVAALRNIKNPAQVARLVMRQTDHVLLVGEGALRFARAHGFQEENLLTEKARKIWLYWKQSLSEKDDWIPPPDLELDPEIRKYFGRPTGTIHLAGINAAGDISCVTSTSGLAFKIPGRVGDSPIVGAGLYVDNTVGSCGSTGRGEANLQNLSSFAGVEMMRQGMSPEEAGMEVLRRVAKTTPKRLLDDKGRPNYSLKFYLLSKDGRHAGVSMWGPAEFSVTDKSGSRIEKCVFLHEGEPAD
ncbi:MAG: N(4)-(beta-N-acetylglucosaminyl)-L-asparaginase [Planctomycetia bacterium]|nr:N(4)-(beta-N-acetylglucosaminyl)-L-asparaginase [Planctomycetia bacterium]